MALTVNQLDNLPQNAREAVIEVLLNNDRPGVMDVAKALRRGTGRPLHAVAELARMILRQEGW